MKNFWKNKRVLVTGAAGFIGGKICSELLRREAKITGIIRSYKHLGNLVDIKNKLKIKEVDLTNQAQTSHLIDDEKIIIHTASVDGGSQFKNKFAHRIFYDNVRINLNVLGSVKNKSIDRTIFISSAEIYTCINKNRIKESDATLDFQGQNNNWYAYSKIIGEQICFLIEKASTKPILIIRPANIYGLGDTPQRHRLVPTLLESIKNKKKLTLIGSKQVRTFMYIDDFVNNLLALIELKRSGVYNVAGKNTIRVKDFVKLFLKHSSIEIEFKNLNTKNRKSYSDRFVLDVTKIQKVLPRFYDSSYEDRIKEMIKNVSTR